MTPEKLLFPWPTFLELQSLTDSSYIGPTSHAVDEAFDTLLKEWSAGKAARTDEGLKQRFDNLKSNRAKKHRAHDIAEFHVIHHEINARYTLDTSELAAVRELATLTLDEVSPADAELLMEIFAKGMEYHELASKLSKSTGTLKARVSRACHRLRTSPKVAAMRTARVA
jgi:hypothetical protein